MELYANGMFVSSLDDISIERDIKQMVTAREELLRACRAGGQYWPCRWVIDSFISPLSYLETEGFIIYLFTSCFCFCNYRSVYVCGYVHVRAGALKLLIVSFPHFSTWIPEDFIYFKFFHSEIVWFSVITQFSNDFQLASRMRFLSFFLKLCLHMCKGVCMLVNTMPVRRPLESGPRELELEAVVSHWPPCGC